jgi:putative Ca2+/H+ antiporter (TMEM165/GDT1 family)
MNWYLFVSAFTFIFLAAFPGRTTFLMLMMAARGRPLTIFLGALLAFFIQSLISVGMGHFLAFLPPWGIQMAAGILFIYFAFRFWHESSRRIDDAAHPQNQNSFWSAFLVIFIGEWGDVSQVAIASFSARNQQANFTVFLSAVFALWGIAGIAVLVGSRLGRVFKQAHIQKVAAVGFAITGLYLILRAGSLIW